MKPTLEGIYRARKNLESILPPTPLIHSPWLSEILDCDIYLKLETMQPIGSFKIRGATNFVLSMPDKLKKRGVIAASAGNHAQGVAWAARKSKIPATIVMPLNAPLTKVQNTRTLGAEVILHGNHYQEAFEYSQTLIKKSGMTFVHPYEHEWIIEGQATLALELLDQLKDADVVIGSVGGGGLMTGVGTVFKALSPKTRLIACQSAGAPSMVEAVKAGHVVKLDSPRTFADGIAVSKASPRMLTLLKPLVHEFVTATDEETAAAVVRLIEKAKIVAEGSGAISLAVAEKLKSKLKKKKVVLLISGGNIDVNLLGRVIDRGLTRTGRRIRVDAVIPDRPGSLALIAQTIANQGANILQAIHDRNEPSITIDLTDVELTLETRGPEHAKEVIESLKKVAIRVEMPRQ